MNIFQRLKSLLIPPDKTDYILFVELVEFDVCPYLLGQRKIESEQYSYILDEYERYLNQNDISLFERTF